jgi:glycosyltransferase involved in cell wall biosynthesis
MINQPKITVGVPVYNGEKFIQKCLDSVLKQTRKDFELIISDNASTDSTPNICKDYQKKDNRVKCIFQKSNFGALNNFKELIENANGEYFLLMAVDNTLSPTFLEKCAEILDSSLNVIGCTSKVAIDGQYVDQFKKEKMILKKIGLEFRALNTIPILGSYDDRIKKFLRKWQWETFYSLFRTDVLKKGAVWETWLGFDGAWILNILKYGEIQVVEEFLLHSYPYGESSVGLLQLAKNNNPSTFGKIFPFYPLTKWCLNNLDRRLFLKNIHHIFRLNIDGIFLQFVSIYQNRKKT